MLVDLAARLRQLGDWLDIAGKHSLANVCIEIAADIGLHVLCRQAAAGWSDGASIGRLRWEEAPDSVPAGESAARAVTPDPCDPRLRPPVHASADDAT